MMFMDLLAIEVPWGHFSVQAFSRDGCGSEKLNLARKSSLGMVADLERVRMGQLI